MSDSVILIGGSGHARVIIDCIRASGGEVYGILDDAIAAGVVVQGVSVLGSTADWERYRDYRFLIAIGDNVVRRRIAEKMDVCWATVVHPTAVVSAYASLGAGTIVMAHGTVNAGTTVGCHCILNTGSVVEHDNCLGDFVHISSKAALGGTVSVGDGTLVGIGAAVKNNIHICGGCTIGAGTVVVKDISTPGTYVGIPARRME